MNRASTRNVLGIVLTVLGTLKVCALVSGSIGFYFFAQTLAFAPLPLPFRSFGNYENFSSKRIYNVYFFDGSTASATDADVVAALHGPHRAKIPILQAGMLLPVVDANVTTNILHFAFCSPKSSLAREAFGRSDVARVRITTFAKNGDTWRNTVECL